MTIKKEITHKIEMILRMIKKIIKQLFTQSETVEKKIDYYINHGRIPWSTGYDEYKWQQIASGINNESFLSNFNGNKKLIKYGIGIDERIVEYPWILSNLSSAQSSILDAGSTFNFREIVGLDLLKNKKLSILTFSPEPNCFHNLNISYVFSDLRNIPFKDKLFDEVICQSTIEHIGMDNGIYGFTEMITPDPQSKTYEFLQAITELLRVLKNGGVMLITFPYGRYENHSFFQQFDEEMTSRILGLLNLEGVYSLTFFKYQNDGWQFSSMEECNDLQSYNPHSGVGKGVDGAAHSRGICCIKFNKSK